MERVRPVQKGCRSKVRTAWDIYNVLSAVALAYLGCISLSVQGSMVTAPNDIIIHGLSFRWVLAVLHIAAIGNFARGLEMRASMKAAS